MITEIHISNFALIEQQSISFEKGLNVISGETGAGKSILLQAIQMLLGEKPKGNVIRHGAESAEVQGIIDVSDISEQIRNELPEIALGSGLGHSSEIALVRTLNSNGRSKVFINGRLASLAVLEEVTSKLVNICSQNQHVRLLDPKYHRELLDNFCGADAHKSAYKAAYTGLRQTETALRTFDSDRANQLQELEDAKERIQELSAIEIKPGIRSELEQRVKVLSGAERILTALDRLRSELEGESQLSSSLQRIHSDALEIKKIDAAFSKPLEVLQIAETAIQDLSVELDRYARSIEIDEVGLSQLREHLAEIARLERKYKTNDQGLLKILFESKNILEQRGAESDGETLRLQRETFHKELVVIGKKITKLRKEGATKLCEQVQAGLRELSMPGSILFVELKEIDQEFGPEGFEDVEFTLSANLGEPPKPLNQVASGGELSRLLLILKQVLTDRTGVNVLVFDEVDTGVSGSVARAMGQKLRQLAALSQVICVTHLPQVASMADHHLLVGKEQGERTVTTVKTLSKAEKIEEIARMLAGYKITDASRESARELLSSK